MYKFVGGFCVAAGQIPANLILDTPQAAVPVVGSTVTRQVSFLWDYFQVIKILEIMLIDTSMIMS